MYDLVGLHIYLALSHPLPCPHEDPPNTPAPPSELTISANNSTIIYFMVHTPNFELSITLLSTPSHIQTVSKSYQLHFDSITECYHLVYVTIIYHLNQQPPNCSL